MILTKDKKNADQYKEVVDLVVKSEQTVIMFDAVTFEQFAHPRSTKQIHCQLFTKHPVSIMHPGITSGSRSVSWRCLARMCRCWAVAGLILMGYEQAEYSYTELI